MNQDKRMGRTLLQVYCTVLLDLIQCSIAFTALLSQTGPKLDALGLLAGTSAVNSSEIISTMSLCPLTHEEITDMKHHIYT